MSDENKQDGETKLYAGKYKTVEELEEGYKKSLPLYQENENLKKELNAQKAPESYQNPQVELDANRLTDLQSRAKDLGMTQAQYEKFVQSEKARVDSAKQRFEDARKNVGADNINVLQDYVKNHYPVELQDGVLNTLITNENARKSALAHRQKLLESKAPGIGHNSPQRFTVTNDDVKKAYEAKEKNPGDMKARQNYLNLVSQYAEQKTA